jgi:Domain of unknown function (DUF4337)
MPELELPDLHEIEEQKEKRFSRRVALVTAVYAVLLAITALGGNTASKEMILSQQQASDQWAFYQAKSIREQLYNTQSMMAGAANYEGLAKQLKAGAVKYEGDKKELETEARKLEKERDMYRAKDPYFDLGEALLQIAIVLASISILAASGPVFIGSLISAVLGTFLMLNGYFMFVSLPFFH